MPCETLNIRFSVIAKRRHLARAQPRRHLGGATVLAPIDDDGLGEAQLGIGVPTANRSRAFVKEPPELAIGDEF